jgi:hypothetical protein
MRVINASHTSDSWDRRVGERGKMFSCHLVSKEGPSLTAIDIVVFSSFAAYLLKIL